MGELVVEPRDGARPEELTARVALVNGTGEPAAMNLTLLGSPSLALEIVDSSGEPVPMPPPPTPGGEMEIHALAPGERHHIEYRGFVPPSTRPGRYRVRLREVAGATSDWAEFAIGSADHPYEGAS
jgi:hypothetical protein